MSLTYGMSRWLHCAVLIGGTSAKYASTLCTRLLRPSSVSHSD